MNNQVIELCVIQNYIFYCSGRVNLASPFIYYQFLVLRYSSRRNPYTKTMFYELKVSAEMFASKPSCPQIVSNLIHKSIATLSRLAPVTVHQQ